MDELLVFPGGDLVQKGIQDLAAGVTSEEALLASIAAPRLRGLGLFVPEIVGVERPYEHALYLALQDRLGVEAHLAYNALIGRVVSFANSYSP